MVIAAVLDSLTKRVVPVISRASTVSAALAVNLTVSIEVRFGLTDSTALMVALNVSLPSPPSSVSPVSKVLAVEPLKVSAAVPVVIVSAPMVSVFAIATVFGSVSSLVMVPVPVTSAVRSLPENFTFTVSPASKSASPLTVTATVALVAPTAKLTEPAAASKSVPAVAVPVVNVS